MLSKGLTPAKWGQFPLAQKGEAPFSLRADAQFLVSSVGQTRSQETAVASGRGLRLGDPLHQRPDGETGQVTEFVRICFITSEVGQMPKPS